MIDTRECANRFEGFGGGGLEKSIKTLQRIPGNEPGAQELAEERAMTSEEIGQFLEWVGDTGPRTEALRKFIGFINTLLPKWIESIKALSFYPESGALPADHDDPDSPEAIALECLTSVSSTKTLVDELEECLEGIGRLELRTLIHDINNKIAPLRTNAPYLLEDLTIPVPDAAIVGPIDAQVGQLVSFIEGIRAAYAAYEKKTPPQWENLLTREFIPPEAQNLELPDGCNIFIIDDEGAVRRSAARTIEHAGGCICGEASNVKEIWKYLRNNTDPPNVDVFLLDNDLDGSFGHAFIEKLQQKVPGALIIAHTSDAALLDADPQNEYAQAGVVVVNKYEWNRITELVKK